MFRHEFAESCEPWNMTVNPLSQNDTLKYVLERLKNVSPKKIVSNYILPLFYNFSNFQQLSTIFIQQHKSFIFFTWPYIYNVFKNNKSFGNFKYVSFITSSRVFIKQNWIHLEIKESTSPIYHIAADVLKLWWEFLCLSNKNCETI